MAMPKRPELRSLPSVGSLLESEEMSALQSLAPRSVLVAAAREAIAAARSAIRRGGRGKPEAAGREAILRDAARRVGEAVRPAFRPVINATGIVLHTNLGRAPLPEEAVSAVTDAARRYTNLELDLESGSRGSRMAHLEPLIAELLGAEAAYVVNNNAAAMLLALNTFSLGKEAVVSRGQLVEIGGSFRIPEILERAGARLREVGTTNKTRLRDYERAIGTETGMILRVHPSNFAMVGFTEEISRDGDCPRNRSPAMRSPRACRSSASAETSCSAVPRRGSSPDERVSSPRSRRIRWHARSAWTS